MSRNKRPLDPRAQERAEYIKSWNDFIAGLKRDAAKNKEAAQHPVQQPQRKPVDMPREEDESNVERKYYLTNDMKEVTDDKGRMHKLHRIVAARDIPSIGVEEGDLGGYVESDKNLSHRGTCWVFEGCVFGQALVKDGATVRGEKVRVYDYATLSDGFTAYDSVKLHGNFRGGGCAKACKYADCADYAIVTGSSYVTGFTIMRGHTKVCGNARADGNTIMNGVAEFHGDYSSFGGSYSHRIMGVNEKQQNGPYTAR